MSLQKISPEMLRHAYGIRFHHLFTRAGRLLATIATEPVEPDNKTVAVACAVCALGDSPTRKRGREIALGRLETGMVVFMPLEDLKRRIIDRSIVAEFLSDHAAFRLGYGGDFHPKTGLREVEGSVGRLVADLRPRKEFA
jgi:hypothetical protein